MHEEEEDVEGITREVFSLFWMECLPCYFEGITAFRPRVDADCTSELFKLLGTIVSHGYVLTGTFPMQIAQSALMGALIGHVSDENLLQDFMLYVSEDERRAIRGVLHGKNVDVLECLSNFNVRHRVTKETLRETLLSIARCEFVTKIHTVMTALKEGMVSCNQELWSEVKSSALTSLYSSLQITKQRLAKAIVPSQDYLPLTKDRERVFKFLQCFLCNSSPELATSFVRFCTGATVMVVDTIEKSFVNVSGLACRPVAHTCVPAIDLSTMYESYAAFNLEMTKVLNNEDAYQFNAP